MLHSERIFYAHSLSGRPLSEWEPLRDHLDHVAKTCARFAGMFGWSELARVAGQLHDIGKCSAAFGTYIAEAAQGKLERGPDHSTAGACEALKRYDPQFGQVLAFIIAGHHAGLADGEELGKRLKKDLLPYDGWQSQSGQLPLLAGLVPTQRFRLAENKGFSLAFLIRILFSCLVDADRCETAAFYARAEKLSIDGVDGTPIAVLRDRLRIFMAAKGQTARQGARSETQRHLNKLRAEILEHAIGKASLAPGLFTLTVPTGGGKTLASLSFALEHAATHDLRRVVYVIPFTSIIEQTAAVFRSALGPSSEMPNTGDVLEHHANFDWDSAMRRGRADEENGAGPNPAERLHRATENWDVPIIVTTAVQFFESLFASRTSSCRKLHNLAKSVIVLDEAQTLPLRILRPCLAALDELARNYGASIVVCTATQPAWRKIDGKLLEHAPVGKTGKNFGLDIPYERELAPDPQRLFSTLKRVEVDYRKEPVDNEVIVSRFVEQDQMLCIVNSRRHAKVLFDSIKTLPGAIHLSTWMCPRHRRLVLEHARADLAAERPVRIVSTSLIEAGVDIDLPEVWRAAAGLDSLLQAAGRCNREFRQRSGRLVIFEPTNDKGPHDLQQAWQAGRSVLRRHTDPQTLEAITAFFGELYQNSGGGSFDASTLENKVWPILPHIGERADTMLFPFASIARAFRVIEDTMSPVIVPWSSGPDDDDAKSLFARIDAMGKPARHDLRRLQQYTVSIPARQRDAWLVAGVLYPVHQALGEAMLRFDDLAHYDARSGLRVGEPELRSSEKNVM